MSSKRFDWFRCYPERMLKATATLKPNEALLYWTILFRIYAVDGPCPDDIAVLARRTGLSRKAVREALSVLLKTGKVFEADGGLMDTLALDQLIERHEYGSDHSAQKAPDHSGKSKQNQRNGSTQTQEHKQKQDINLPFGQVDTRASVALAPPVGVKLDGWTPSAEDVSFGLEQKLTPDEIRVEAIKFQNHFLSKGVDGFINPSRRFRNWLVNASIFKSRSNLEAERRAAKTSGPDFYDVASGRFN